AIDVARTKALRIDFDKFAPVKPSFLGRKEFLDFDLSKLIPYIDWKPFFDVWQLRGKYPNRSYPRIFKDEQDAQKWLSNIIKEKKLKANAVIGFFEAGSVGDDIHIFENGKEKAIFYGLRQQSGREHDQPHLCMSDFVKPLHDGGRFELCGTGSY
ncbi:unnamed protein product, partial [Strongylus vulgaris]